MTRLPGSGKHNVNNIDSFFKVRPSRTTIREGETISFLEKGNLVKQEKRNGVVYETIYQEQNTKQESTTTVVSSGGSAVGDITAVSAGTGLSGGGVSGPVTLSIDSTVTTLTGTQTLTNKTLTAPTFTGTAQGASLTLTGDLTVQGDTTTLNTATLQVEDKNIVLNYHASSDTSGSADGAGITIQDAVNSSTDATMLWDATNDEFDFSHTITAPNFTGNVTGNVTGSASLNLLTSNNLSDLANAGTARNNLGLGTLAQKSEIDDIDQIGAGVKLVIGETFVDSDANLMTAGAIDDRIDAKISASTYSFTVTADSGSNQGIASGNTLDIAGGTGISTTVGATDTVTVNVAKPSTELDEAMVSADSFLIFDGTSPKFISPSNVGQSLAIADLSGTLAVNKGGTGATSLTDNSVLTGTGTSAITAESDLTYDGTLQLGTANAQKIIKISGNRSMFGYNANFAIVQGGNTKGIKFNTNTDTFGGSPKMTITTAGDVGIGTESPGNKLEVRGDIAVAISDTQDIIKLSDAGSDGSIELYTGESTPVLRTKLTAYGDSYFNSSSVKLGIGTASPTDTLQVEGSIGVGVGRDAQLTSVNNGLAIRNLVSDADMFFYVNDGGSDTEAMRIDGATANIGIGTNSPTSLLTTSGGDIRILGSNNRLRFNTNGSIYWDSSVGVKLENASSENIITKPIQVVIFI